MTFPFGSTLPPITLVTRVLPGVGPSVTNSATVSTPDETLLGNNTATAIAPVTQADIGLTKTVDDPTPNVGSNVHFVVTATNHGPGDATGVQVTDQLPATLTFVSATQSQGTYYPATGLWDIGSLGNGASAILQVTATVTRSGPITNTATKTAADQPDTNVANDTASATVNGQEADVGVTKTVDQPTPQIQSHVAFTVTATNHGPSDATGLQVGDPLPTGLTLVSRSVRRPTCRSKSAFWSWDDTRA